MLQRTGAVTVLQGQPHGLRCMLLATLFAFAFFHASYSHHEVLPAQDHLVECSLCLQSGTADALLPGAFFVQAGEARNDFFLIANQGRQQAQLLLPPARAPPFS